MAQTEVDEMVALLNRENAAIQLQPASSYSNAKRHEMFEREIEPEYDDESDDDDLPTENRTVGDWISSPFSKLALAGVGVAGFLGFIGMMILPSGSSKKSDTSPTPTPLSTPSQAKKESPDYRAALALQTQANAKKTKPVGTLPTVKVNKTTDPPLKPIAASSAPAPIETRVQRVLPLIAPPPPESVPAPAPRVAHNTISTPSPSIPAETPDQEWNRLSNENNYGQVPTGTSATLVANSATNDGGDTAEDSSNPIDSSQTDSARDVVALNSDSSTPNIANSTKQLTRKQTSNQFSPDLNSDAPSLPRLSYAQTPGGPKKVLIGSQTSAEVVSTVAVFNTNTASVQSGTKVLLKLKDDLKAVDGSVVIPKNSTIVASMGGVNAGGVSLQPLEVVIGTEEFALPPGIVIRGDGSPLLSAQRLHNSRSQSGNRLVPAILGGLANSAVNRIDSTGVAGNVVGNVLNTSGLSNASDSNLDANPWTIKAGQKVQIYANQTLVF